jgi:hypothetical protein
LFVRFVDGLEGFLERGGSVGCGGELREKKAGDSGREMLEVKGTGQKCVRREGKSRVQMCEKARGKTGGKCVLNRRGKSNRVDEKERKSRVG